jgi:hypothetical protein
LITCGTEDPGRAAVHEPLQAWQSLTALQQEFCSLDVRPPVFAERFTGFEQLAGQVVDDGDVVQGALYRAAVGDIAEDRLGAAINQVPGF